MIKNNLLHVLVDKDMSMKALSDELGIAYPTIWRFGKMEAGSINFEVLNSICSYLAVQPGDLLVFVEDETPASS